MKTITVIFDALLLLSVWWPTFVAIHKSGHVSTWRAAATLSALIVASVFSLCGALAVVWTFEPVQWWARGLLFAAAVAAHLRPVREWIHERAHT